MNAERPPKLLVRKFVKYTAIVLVLIFIVLGIVILVVGYEIKSVFHPISPELRDHPTN